MSGAGAFDDRFDAGHLDPAVWTAGYLPAWSSLAESAATYRIAVDGLHLTIPPEHPLWCPDLHDGPLRVSAVQTGNWSGPVGSTQGQQPFRDGLVVREEQPARWGFTPRFAAVEVVCRAFISDRSMFSAWLVGLEDDPRHCGEICIVEVFGDSVQVDSHGEVTAELGTGIHRFRDPLLREEFSADRAAIDISAPHAYSVQWQPDSVTFLLDGEPVKQLSQAPDYPMQLMLGVFDFPDREVRSGGSGAVIPELVVSAVRGRPLPPRTDRLATFVSSSSRGTADIGESMGAHGPRLDAADLGGDPVCWAPRVCPDCGLFVPVEPPTVCPRCGGMVGVD